MSRDTGDRWSDHPCEALSALVDGELEAGERAAVEAHLAACLICRALKDDVELLDRAVAAEPPPPVPADLAARIRGRLAGGASAPAVARPWWAPRWPVPMPAAAAAAAVVVATLAWLAWPGGRPQDAAMRAGDIATHEAAGAAGTTGTADAPATADTLPRLRSLGYLRTPAEPPATAPAPAPAPAPTPALAPPPPPANPAAPSIAQKAAPQRPQAPTGLAREGVEAKSRASGSPAGADFDAETGNRQLVKTLKKDAAPAAETLTTPMALRESAVAEATAASGGSAPPVAPRPLDASPYIVSLEPEEAMTVRVRDYECTIPIAPADARLLAAFGAPAPTTATASVPVARKAEAGAAPAAGAPAAARPAAPAAGTVGAGSTAGSPGAVAQPAEPAPVVLPPAARQTVVYLVRERYRALLEERCGPLPR
jgi:putative zinc finger protein